MNNLIDRLAAPLACFMLFFTVIIFPVLAFVNFSFVFGLLTTIVLWIISIASMVIFKISKEMMI